ncbi:MAG: sigma-70 family RNA polymerase sigma factor [Acidimicrobiia bacterium]|nr:sigma-70 family RNA polymerase sigma factor [Acidimicrobiia bacterium]
MADFGTLFTEIYEEHFRSVFAYCRRRVSADHVDDATAETFLVAWKKINEMPSGDRTLPWLYGIAYRVLMHQWRGGFRRRRLEGRLASLGIEVAHPPEEYVVADEESRRVHQALARLKPTDQEILRLALWEELPYSDIATLLGIRSDAARKRYSRAMKNLTREFDKRETSFGDSALLRREVSGDH